MINSDLLNKRSVSVTVTVNMENGKTQSFTINDFSTMNDYIDRVIASASAMENAYSIDITTKIVLNHNDDSEIYPYENAF